MNNYAILLSGTAGLNLSKKISRAGNIHLGKVYHHSFPSGEKYIQIEENIRGKDVFLIQSTSYPANDNLMELLIMIDAAKRASSERITVVIPSSVCYSRQDKKDKSRTPISAKLIANLITTAGANRILGMDFHSEQFSGFFDIPVDHLSSIPIFINYINDLKLNNIVVISPDEGGVKRSFIMAKFLSSEFGFNCKNRINDETIESQGFVGNVKGKNVIIYDDITESCGTLIEVSKICKQRGALSVRGLIAHNCLTETGRGRLIIDKFLDELIVTNSVDSILSKKMKVLDVSGLFADAINRIHNSESVSILFEVNSSLTENSRE